MFIIVNHNIRAPEAFWRIVKEQLSELPARFKLHSLYPSVDRLRCFSIWDAENTAALNEMLRTCFGDFSRDELIEINRDAAFGFLRNVHQSTN
jgi:hypothetical protein